MRTAFAVALAVAVPFAVTVRIEQWTAQKKLRRAMAAMIVGGLLPVWFALLLLGRGWSPGLIATLAVACTFSSALFGRGTYLGSKHWGGSPTS